MIYFITITTVHSSVVSFSYYHNCIEIFQLTMAVQTSEKMFREINKKTAGIRAKLQMRQNIHNCFSPRTGRGGGGFYMLYYIRPYISQFTVTLPARRNRGRGLGAAAPQIFAKFYFL